MSLSKKVVLTVSGYKISLSDSLQFYQNDQLKLIFEINKYGIDVANSYASKTLMPLQPLTATLFIETPLGVDSIESANIEDNAVTFYLTSNQTQHIGTSTMQIKLTDDDGCQITLPSFTFEVQKNIYDNAVQVSDILLADENGNTVSDENGNTVNATATTETSKQIKDFSLKTGVSGQEDILIQDNGVTKRIKSRELMDTVDLTGYATKDELNNKADISSIPTKTSQLTNDSGYMTSVPLEYVTEIELNEKGYLTEHQDISMKADKSEIPSLDGYATETFVTNKIAEASLSGGEVDLSGLATKDELNTGLSTKSNVGHIHEQYLTEHQDISMKADKTELHSHDNKTALDSITETKITEWNNKSDFDGDYNSLTNKPDIPTVDVNKNYVDTQLATKANKSEIPSLDGYATETYVQNKIAEAALSGGEVDLSGYATKDELATKADISSIPTKTSQLTNDSGFITSVPSEYITESELNTKGYLTEHQDITGKADKSYVDSELAKKSDTTHTHSYNDLTDKPTIPSVDNLATKVELTDGLATKANVSHTHDQYLTEHQDISMKADKTELHSHTNKTVLDGITSTKITEWNNKSNFDGNYNSLTNKPTIPTNTSQLTNDSGFITTIPTEYVTETELNTGLSSYQTKTDNTLTTTSKTVVGAINELNQIKIVALTQSEYDRLTSKDANTVYLITG